MRRLNTRQLSKRFHKEMDVLPIQVMKNQKPYAVVLSWEDYQKGFSLRNLMQADAIDKGNTIELEYKGIPIITDDPSTSFQIDKAQAHVEAWRGGSTMVKDKPSVIDKLKSVLTKKVL